MYWMDWVRWLILLAILIGCILLVMQIFSRIKRRKALTDMQFLGKKHFQIVRKGASKVGRDSRKGHLYWYEIATSDGRYKNRISNEGSGIDYAKVRKGTPIGEREVYVSAHDSRIVETVPVGEKPDFSGTTEIIEVCVYVGIIFVLILGGSYIWEWLR